ncbi:hypothetical protein RRG08_005116, partial [Elysia crispata]
LPSNGTSTERQLAASALANLGPLRYRLADRGGEQGGRQRVGLYLYSLSYCLHQRNRESYHYLVITGQRACTVDAVPVEFGNPRDTGRITVSSLPA